MFIWFFVFTLVTLSQAGPYHKSEEKSGINSLTDAKSEPKDSSTGLPESERPKDNQFAATQVFENPAYDPSLYQSFIPQESVQQYVNHYPSPYGGYSGLYPNPGGFAVQTGYEGYLVPTAPQPEDTSLSTSSSFSMFGILRSLMSRSVVSWMSRAASYVMSALGVLLFGGAVTTALCTFTPFCTISFAALPFLRFRESAQNITQTLGVELTPDRIRRTAELVKEAIDKYTELQNIQEDVGEEESNVQKIDQTARSKIE